MVFSTIASAVGPAGPADPLSRCTPPTFSNPAIRARIEGGAAVVEVLPGKGPDLGVFGTARVGVDGDRLVAWARRIEDFEKSQYVPVLVRFSEPPRLADLDALELGEDELDEVRHCRIGDCSIKLAAHEIERLREIAPTRDTERRAAVQAAFRQMMLDRALSYLSHGYDRTEPFADHGHPVTLGTEFEAVLARMRNGSLQPPGVLEDLRRFPRSTGGNDESFLYWSKDLFGAGKPVVSITHVVIARPSGVTGLDALIASKQIFATHYLSASLSVLGVTHPSASGNRYLLYSRHSRVDLFEGPFAGMTRRLVEKRIRAGAPAALDAMRRRLESGDPLGPGPSSR
jgi:hypothetical protein